MRANVFICYVWFLEFPWMIGKHQHKRLHLRRSILQEFHPNRRHNLRHGSHCRIGNDRRNNNVRRCMSRPHIPTDHLRNYLKFISLVITALSQNEMMEPPGILCNFSSSMWGVKFPKKFSKFSELSVDFLSKKYILSKLLKKENKK